MRLDSFFLQYLFFFQTSFYIFSLSASYHVSRASYMYIVSSLFLFFYSRNFFRYIFIVILSFRWSSECMYIVFVRISFPSFVSLCVLCAISI